MADNQGLLGARSTEPPNDGAGSLGSGAPAHEDREAYEEDWYRSLRALAERQQAIADQEAEPDGEDEAPEEPEPEEPAPDALFAPLEAERLERELGHTGPEDPTQAIADLLAAATHPGAEPHPHPRRDGYEPHLHVVATPEEQQEEDLGWPAEGESRAEEERRAEDDATQSFAEPEPAMFESDAEEHEESALPTEPHYAVETLDEAAVQDAVQESELGESDAAVVEDALERAGPSLTSTDPRERRLALEALATHELSEADTNRVEAMLLDPEADIRMMALGALVRRPDRVSAGAAWQALQDPVDDVRAVAVEIAAQRGDAGQIALLFAARDWPLTQRVVLQRLPEVIARGPVDDRVLGKVLGAVGDLDPGPERDEEPALRQLALALGSRRLLDALMWPDVPRLGAIRLLSHDRSPDVLRELASYDSDPIDEIRAFAVAARAELAEAEASRAAPRRRRRAGRRGDRAHYVARPGPARRRRDGSPPGSFGSGRDGPRGHRGVGAGGDRERRRVAAVACGLHRADAPPRPGRGGHPRRGRRAAGPCAPEPRRRAHLVRHASRSARRSPPADP